MEVDCDRWREGVCACCFFFQAEDGIRDVAVTGVQTCALPISLKWLLDHGADPNCPSPRPKYAGTALDYVIGTYGRSPELGACMDALLDAGGTTKHNVPLVLDLLRSRLDRLAEQLDADPALLHQPFPELDRKSVV